MRARLLPLLTIAVLGCGKKEGDDHVACDAPGGCAAVHSTLDTGEAFAELVPDGEGGVYAALFGSGFEAACAGGVICHGELWRIDANGDVRWKEKEKKSVSNAFAVDGGVGYLTGAGKVVVLNASGSRRFSVATEDPDAVTSVIANDLYIAAGGRLRRIDLATGDELWDEPLPEERPIAPAGTGDGYVVTMGFVAGSSGVLTARTFAQADGKSGWTVDLPAQLSAPGLVTPYSDLGPVLLVSDVLSLRGWDGVEYWRIAADAPPFEGFRFVSRTRENGFFASGPFLDQVSEYREDGTVAFSRPMTAVTWVSPTSDGHVLVGQADGVVRKLKQGSGVTLWDYGGVGTVKAQARPIYASSGNVVFWGANVGIDSDTHLSTVTPFGQGLDRWDAGARIVAGALSDDDDVFVATKDGLIYLREAASF